ncbi:hypothetical protein F4808DRAFT_468335 [Astrocystis sublimbata]|nr:hypothetical protein F4808DRAFT_468335 [Astrocystis sublimbata]
MAPFLFTLATVLASFGVTLADCQLENLIESAKTPKLSDQLCLGQGQGSYTFSMHVTEIGEPTFSSSATRAGYVRREDFLIYDESCNLKGVYLPHPTNDCEAPYVIQENWLPYTLTVGNVDFRAGRPYFKFYYANGAYSIRNNHCVCNTIESDLPFEVGCRCAFPIEGEGNSKSSLPRSGPFEA